MLGVSQAAISDYERGRRRPGVEALAEIAKHLAVDAGWLLTGDTPAEPRRAGEHGHTAGAAAASTAELLRANLSELMGVSALPYHGRVGLLQDGELQWAARRPDEVIPRAAEQRAGYGDGAAAAVEGQAGSFVFDRTLAYGAEALATYEGPAVGPFAPGDVLLLAYRDGYPGIRVFRRADGRAGTDGGAEMAVEPDGASAKVTAGPRVVALLRQL